MATARPSPDSPAVLVREDDLTDPRVRALLAHHVADLRAQSPAGEAHALPLSDLEVPDVTVWSAWQGERLLGVGALRSLPDGSAELKSMRTHPDALRRGVATRVLDHLVEAARSRGVWRLRLETGRGPAFDPAVALYRRRGFVPSVAFADYAAGEHHQFLHLDLDPPPPRPA